MSQESLSGDLEIRELEEADVKALDAAFVQQGWPSRRGSFERYLAEQSQGERTVLVADLGGKLAGYLTIRWRAFYPPFRDAGIPEILDFNVAAAFQRRGIGNALMDAAEGRIAERSTFAGLGVGLTADYGNALALYIKRGYLPDRKGLSLRGNFPAFGEKVRVDDDLVLCFTKELSRRRNV